jgi:hypothetical protein
LPNSYRILLTDGNSGMNRSRSKFVRREPSGPHNYEKSVCCRFAAGAA